MEDKKGVERVLAQLRADSKRKFWTKAVFYSLVLATLIAGAMTGKQSVGEHIAVVDITGAISSSSMSGSGRKLDDVFLSMDAEDVKHVLIYADSPGGSPSQAEMIFDAVQRYKERSGVGVDLIVGDMCASACYFLAMAADKIYAHNTSLIGSIGVKLESYKISRLARFIGVDKDIYESDPTKSMLDIFKGDLPSVKEHLQAELVDSSYEYFKSVVLESRDLDPALLTGLVWTGKRAKELGLVDGIVTYGGLLEELKKSHDVESVEVYNGKITTLFDGLFQSFFKGSLSLEAKI